MTQEEAREYIIKHYGAMPVKDIAQAVGKSRDAVKAIAGRLRGKIKIGEYTQEGSMTTYEGDQKKHVERKTVQHTTEKYKKALERIAALEAEREALLTIHSADVETTILPLEPSSTSEATAFALASDWHVEELVDPKTVQGMNKYNPKIAKERAEAFFQRIVRLTEKERQDVRIDNLVLALLGDFYSGAIHDSLPEICAMRPVKAVLYAQELIASGLRFLIDHGKYKRITVVCKVGNHSRITPKLHVSSELGNSMEYAMYTSLAERFPELKWVIEPSYHSYIVVYGKTVRLAHGWAIKSAGGVGGIYPSLLRAEYQWNLTRKADISVMGHFHHYTSVGRGSIIINGSLIGYTPYASAVARAGYEPPTQAFFLLDKKRGVTVQIPILL